MALAVLVLSPARAGGEGLPHGGAEPVFETEVRARRKVEESTPADDPAGFATLLRLRDPAPGAELTELLAGVPGLRVRDAGPGGRKSLSLRAADSQQVAIVLDGIKLTRAGGGGFDLSLLDPGQLESAEVRRGGGAARFGGGAIGGMLHLHTPRLGGPTRNRAALAYGSFGTMAAHVSRSASVFGSRRLRYLASGSYRQTEGLFEYLDHNGEQQLRHNNDGRSGAALVKLEYLRSQTWAFSLLDDMSAAERGAPGPSHAPSRAARQRDLANLVVLRATRRGLLFEGSRLDLAFHHRLQRFVFDEPGPPPAHADATGHSLGADTSLALPLGSSGRLDAGAELRGELFGDQSTGEHSRLEADVFAASHTRLAGGALVIVPAVRLASASGIGTAVVPRLGLVLRPLTWSRRPALSALELCGNIGRSYRYPSFQEMYIRLDGFGQNPALRPEDALDGDIGLRWRSDWLALEAAYFQRWIRNLIVFAPVAFHLVRADNYPGAAARGVELAAFLQPGLGLALRGSYTFSRTRFGSPPLSLPGHPDHRLTVRLSWEAPWSAPRGGSEGIYERSNGTRGTGHTGDAGAVDAGGGAGGEPASPPGSAGWRASSSLQLWVAATLESEMALDRHNNVHTRPRALLSAGGALSYRWLTLSAEGKNLLDRRDLVDTVGFPLAPANFMFGLAVRR